VDVHVQMAELRAQAYAALRQARVEVHQAREAAAQSAAAAAAAEKRADRARGEWQV